MYMMPAILTTISIPLHQDRRCPCSPPTRLAESCLAPSRTHGTACQGMKACVCASQGGSRQNRSRSVRARARQLTAVRTTMTAMLVCRSMWCQAPVDKGTAFVPPAKGEGSEEVQGGEIDRRWGRDPREPVVIVWGIHSSFPWSKPTQYPFLDLQVNIPTLH